MRTIQHLNDLAAPFLHSNRFVQDARARLFIELRNQEARRWTKRGKISADLRSDRRWFRYRGVSRYVGCGGTAEQTLCQLVLWWRCEPRLPGRVLRSWWAERPDMHGWRKMVEEVYDDDQSLTCILCGQPPVGLDWWSLGKATGPCCSFGRCRPLDSI